MTVEIEFNDGRWVEHKKAQKFRMRKTFWGFKYMYVTDATGTEHKYQADDVRQFNVS